jgi:hypothetical protein
VSRVRRWFSFVFALLVVACGGGSSGDTDATIGTLSSIEIRWAVSAGVTGYRIHWGSRSSEYTTTIDVGMPPGAGGIVTYVLEGLSAPGTYYFAMTSYDDEGRTSAFSNEIAVAVD